MQAEPKYSRKRYIPMLGLARNLSVVRNAPYACLTNPSYLHLYLAIFLIHLVCSQF